MIKQIQSSASWSDTLKAQERLTALLKIVEIKNTSSTCWIHRAASAAQRRPRLPALVSLAN